MAEFTHATPRHLAAARFALYAERLAPILSSLERTLDMPLAGLSPQDKGRIGMAKLAAGRTIPQINALLFPDD